MTRRRRVVGFGAWTNRRGQTRREVETFGQLHDACTTRGSHVTFPPEMAATIVLEEQIDMAHNVSVTGSGANVTLSNDGGRSSGLVFTEGNGTVRDLTFSGWGNPDKPTETQPFPHPIYLLDGMSYVIDHCTFRNNGGKVGIVCAPYVTVSWCHWAPQAKGIQVGNDDAMHCCAANRLTLHHNWFENVASRCPRLKAGYVHSFNNLHDGWSAHAVYALCGGRVLSEHNIYRAATDPSAILTRNNASGDDRHPPCEGPGAVRSVGDLFEGGAVAKLGDSSLVEAPGYHYDLDPVDGLADRLMADAGAPRLAVAT